MSLSNDPCGSKCFYLYTDKWKDLCPCIIISVAKEAVDQTGLAIGFKQSLFLKQLSMSFEWGPKHLIWPWLHQLEWILTATVYKRVPIFTLL